MKGVCVSRGGKACGPYGRYDLMDGVDGEKERSALRGMGRMGHTGGIRIWWVWC